MALGKGISSNEVNRTGKKTKIFLWYLGLYEWEVTETGQDKKKRAI